MVNLLLNFLCLHSSLTMNYHELSMNTSKIKIQSNTKSSTKNKYAEKIVLLFC